LRLGLLLNFPGIDFLLRRSILMVCGHIK